MKVIAGKYRGRVLDFPKHVRPTQDKVRKSMFDYLRLVTEGSRVLDLFAGSGAFGIEAISRGAKSVYFIDHDKRCNSIIEKNLHKLGILDKGDLEVYNFTQDCFRALEILSKKKEVFDIVFLDPPYRSGLAKKALKTLWSSGIVAPYGFVLAEHSRKEEVKGDVPVEPLKETDYGDTRVSVFRSGTVD